MKLKADVALTLPAGAEMVWAGSRVDWQYGDEDDPRVSMTLSDDPSGDPCILFRCDYGHYSDHYLLMAEGSIYYVTQIG